MRRVELGSSAEAGSSISRSWGSTASARAIQRRCCWPPDRLPPGWFSRSFTSSHSPALRKDSSPCARRSALLCREPSLRPAMALSMMLIVGNGVGRWKTMPIRRRTSTGSTAGAYMSLPWNNTLPVILAPRTSSCIRLRHRMSVDFPEPEGPIIAVTDRAFATMLTFFRTWLAPNHALTSDASSAVSLGSRSVAGVATSGAGAVSSPTDPAAPYPASEPSCPALTVTICLLADLWRRFPALGRYGTRLIPG